ncbi:hypothetical protein D3C81_1272370 [compost metagenome]
MHGDAEHRGVAAFPGSVQIDPVVGFEDEAEVDWRVLDLVVVLRLVLVVVTFIFQLERQRVPGRLVSYAAEEGG